MAKLKMRESQRVFYTKDKMYPHFLVWKNNTKNNTETTYRATLTRYDFTDRGYRRQSSVFDLDMDFTSVAKAVKFVHDYINGEAECEEVNKIWL